MSEIADRLHEGKRKKDSAEALREAFMLQLIRDPRLRANDYRLAVAVMKHLNGPKRCAWPGFRLLRQLTGMYPAGIERAIKHIEACGHWHVFRDTVGKRHKANEYTPIIAGKPALMLPEKTTQNDTRVVPPRRYHGTTAQTVPEPLTEPLTEPLILTATAGAVGVREGVGRQESKEGDSRETVIRPSLNPFPSAPSIKSECFRIAREVWPERGASITARAFAQGIRETDVLDTLCNARDAGAGADELAAALWIPEDAHRHRGYPL